MRRTIRGEALNRELSVCVCVCVCVYVCACVCVCKEEKGGITQLHKRSKGHSNTYPSLEGGVATFLNLQAVDGGVRSRSVDT